MHTCRHAYIHTRTCAHMHACMQTPGMHAQPSIHPYIHTYIHIPTLLHTASFVCVCVCVCVCMCMRLSSPCVWYMDAHACACVHAIVAHGGWACRMCIQLDRPMCVCVDDGCVHASKLAMWYMDVHARACVHAIVAHGGCACRMCI
jgi:hypothetical protein